MGVYTEEVLVCHLLLTTGCKVTSAATHRVRVLLLLHEGGELHQPQPGGADGAALPSRGCRYRGLVACDTKAPNPIKANMSVDQSMPEYN